MKIQEQTDRETDRQTDKDNITFNRQKDRQTDRQIDRRRKHNIKQEKRRQFKRDRQKKEKEKSQVDNNKQQVGWKNLHPKSVKVKFKSYTYENDLRPNQVTQSKKPTNNNTVSHTV